MVNLPRSSAINQAASGLRRPSTILDQQHKLVFTYPMLFTNSMRAHETTVRDFFSLNMLKEIFVSNTLHLVSMSSQIQAPSDDDLVDAGQLVGNAILSMRDSRPLPQPSAPDYGTKAELQQKIDQRADRIRRYIDQDLQMRPLNPHMDFITLENLIDVPVIVGTKPFSVDDFSMLLVLVTAVALNRPLDKMSNVDYVIRVLQSSREEDITIFLNNLVQDQNDKTLLDKQIARNSRLRRILGYDSPETIARRAPRRRGIPPAEQYAPDEAMQILRFQKDNLEQVRTFFRFMLEPRAFESQTGISPFQGQMRGVIKTIDPNIQRIAQSMMNEFLSLIGTALTPVLRSVSNIIFPSPSPPDFDFLRTKEQYIDVYLAETIQDVVYDDMIHNLKAAIEAEQAQNVDKKIKAVRSICNDLHKMENVLTNEFSRLTNVSNFRYVGLDRTDYNESDLEKFIFELDRLSSTVNSHIRSFQSGYDKIVPQSHLVFQRAADQINNSIDRFFNQYTQQYRADQVRPYVSELGYIEETAVMRRLIPRLKDALFSLIFFFLIYRLQAAMCQLVDVLEVEVKTASKGVVEWPNYTIVLPIEYIHFLHTVMIAKTWKQLVGNQEFSPSRTPAINDQYVKGIVRYVAQRLQIPNFMFIDQRKNEVYYKFMNMSQPIKARLQAIQTFISQNKN